MCMFNVESVALKKSNSLCFVSKWKFLKSDGVKKRWKHGKKQWRNSASSWKWEWRRFFFVLFCLFFFFWGGGGGDYLNKIIPRKK